MRWLHVILIFTWIFSVGSSLSPTTQNGQHGGAPSFDVRFHPDEVLYPGDLVSIEIWVRQPQGSTLSIDHVSIRREDNRETIGEAQFGPEGPRGSSALHASLMWAWDTEGLAPGTYRLQFRTAPDHYRWLEEVTLKDPQEMPENERDASWASRKSACCQLFFITGTRAERDIERLSKLTDDEARVVEERLGSRFDQPVRITFLPRVLGHGGFAGEELAISYTDRNYAGLPDPTTRQVLRHELVHKLDSQLGGEARPVMLAEGFATYVSEGHYKPEPISARAAALMELDEYIPLNELVNNFYSHQHEAAYLESAALVEYLVKTYGQDQFTKFYRGMRPANTDQAVLEAGLNDFFDTSLVQLEKDFSSYLRAIEPSPQQVQDVQSTLALYDAIRAYQAELDPSAHFREVWMPGAPEMRQRGITADYLRHPSQPENIALESWLIQAHQLLLEGQYQDVMEVISLIGENLAALDHFQKILELFKPRPVPVFGETAWHRLNN